jgi:cytochrome c2
MLRTWVIAGFAVAASTGPTLGQDAAAGEQVFKRLCSPCHEIGQDAKIKLRCAACRACLNRNSIE